MPKGVGGIAIGSGVVLAGAVGLPLLLLLGVGGGTAGVPNPPPVAGPAFDGANVPTEYLAFIEGAGQRCPSSITPALIAAQIDQESGWDPDARNPNSGATGIAQFMPGTWEAFGHDYSNDGFARADDPADAIGSQADLMCHLHDWATEQLELGTVEGDPLDLALAGYNAGQGNVSQYSGVPPFPETQNYIKSIRAKMADYSAEPVAGGGVPGNGGAVTENAGKWLGYPYVWGGGDTSGPTLGSIGGTSTPGFDCSGLIIYSIYHASGGTTVLPHLASEQAKAGVAVSPNLSEMRPGDLLFFALGRRGPIISHTGIYAGDGKMIHATRPGPGQPGSVQIDNLTDTFWGSQRWTVRRIEGVS